LLRQKSPWLAAASSGGASQVLTPLRPGKFFCRCFLGRLQKLSSQKSNVILPESCRPWGINHSRPILLLAGKPMVRKTSGPFPLVQWVDPPPPGGLAFACTIKKVSAGLSVPCSFLRRQCGDPGPPGATQPSLPTHPGLIFLLSLVTAQRLVLCADRRVALTLSPNPGGTTAF